MVLRGFLAGLASVAVLNGAALAADTPFADPLAGLTRDVSGVLDPSSDPRLLLLEEQHGVFSSRILRPGEEYAEGWVLTAIRANAAVLRKGDAERTVAIRGRDPQQQTAASSPPLAPLTARAGAPLPPPQTLALLSPPPAPAIPAKPRATNTTAARRIGPAAHTQEDLNRLSKGLLANTGDAPTPQVLLGNDLHDVLVSLGTAAAVSNIPQGQRLAVDAEVWLADGSYSPRSLTYANSGGYNNAIDFAPLGGSSIYGSATTYDVDGDMVTIHKAFQVNGQYYALPAAPVRSGETAVFQLPDGTVYRVTPTVQKG